MVTRLYGKMGAEDSLLMPQKSPSPLPPRPALSPQAKARHRARARRRRQILVGTLFAAVAISGVLAWQRLDRTPDGNPAGLFQGTVRAHGNEAILNGEVLANAVKVQAALEAYRRERGAIPANAEAFNRDVLPRLEGGRLPRSPWGGEQAGMLEVSPALSRAVAADGDERWVVGPGHEAGAITQPTDFGALVYEATGQNYRIFGIGRGADGRAVVLVRLTGP